MIYATCCPSLEALPILGICGASGAGKTTLLESIIRHYTKQHLRVAAVKHDAIRVQVDRPGKDSDRFFQAGANTAIFARERFYRWHGREPLGPFLARLARQHDLVLVEGHTKTEVPKIWLLDSHHTAPPAKANHILATFSRAQVDQGEVHAWLENWFRCQWSRRPIWAAILIGGKSRRMGYPKHLIQKDGQTWLEHTVALLTPLVDQLVLSGRGEVPPALCHLPRIPDAPGLAGPMAGLLGCLRHQPAAAWLAVACDLPHLRPEAVRWLLDQRTPGVRAILPDLKGTGRLEPLLACYEPGCRPLIEDLAWQECLQLSHLHRETGVTTPVPPAVLHSCWRNINRPEDLE